MRSLATWARPQAESNCFLALRGRETYHERICLEVRTENKESLECMHLS